MKIDIEKLDWDIRSYQFNNGRMSDKKFCKVANLGSNTLNYIRKKGSMTTRTMGKIRKVLGKDAIEILE